MVISVWAFLLVLGAVFAMVFVSVGLGAFLVFRTKFVQLGAPFLGPITDKPESAGPGETYGGDLFNVGQSFSNQGLDNPMAYMSGFGGEKFNPIEDDGSPEAAMKIVTGENRG